MPLFKTDARSLKMTALSHKFRCYFAIDQLKMLPNSNHDLVITEIIFMEYSSKPKKTNGKTWICRNRWENWSLQSEHWVAHKPFSHEAFKIFLSFNTLNQLIKCLEFWKPTLYRENEIQHCYFYWWWCMKTMKRHGMTQAQTNIVRAFMRNFFTNVLFFGWADSPWFRIFINK